MSEFDLALFSAPGQLPDIDLIPSKSALLVIDMQYLDAHPDWGIGKKAKLLGTEEQLVYYFHRLSTLTIPNIKALLETCRSQGLEVIHVRVASLSKDGREVGWRHRQLGLVVPAGAKEAEFLPEVGPLPGEMVISKTTSGVFASTNLDLILKNLGVEVVIVAGVTSNNCVESSTREAADRGFRVIVAEDATATFSPEMQESARKNIHRNFAVMLSTAEIVEQIRNLNGAGD